MDTAVPRAAAGFSRRSAAAFRRFLRTGRARPDAVRSFDGHRQRYGVRHGHGGATLAGFRRRSRAVCAGGVAGQGVFRFRRRAPVLRRCRERAVGVEILRAAGRRQGPKTLGQWAAHLLVARLGRTGAARRRAVLWLRNLVNLRRLHTRPRPQLGQGDLDERGQQPHRQSQHGSRDRQRGRLDAAGLSGGGQRQAGGSVRRSTARLPGLEDRRRGHVHDGLGRQERFAQRNLVRGRRRPLPQPRRRLVRHHPCERRETERSALGDGLQEHAVPWRIHAAVHRPDQPERSR